MKLLLLSIFSLLIVGCNLKDEKDADIEKKLIDCYQATFQNDELMPTDPIAYYKKVEQYLIDNNYLEGRSRKDYLQLWDDIYDTTKVISVKEFGTQNGMTMMTMNYVRSKYCYYSLVEQQKLQDRQLRQVEKLLDQMDSIGNIGDIVLNKKLINAIDEDRFEQIVFRIPTLTYMYLTIEHLHWNRYGRYDPNINRGRHRD